MTFYVDIAWRSSAKGSAITIQWTKMAIFKIYMHLHVCAKISHKR